MKLKLKLALEAVEHRDFISDENRNAYGEGFLEGFDKCKDMMRGHLSTGPFNEWETKIRRDMENLGEEEIAMKKKSVKAKKAQKKKKPGLSSRRSTKKEASSPSKKSKPQKQEQDEHQKKLELICLLSLHTASLALARDEYVEFAPIGGSCVPFKLFGNSLPVFEYRVFEQKLMEFIKIRVEISKPDTIRYIGTIDCQGVKGQHSDAARHGQEVEVLPKYKEPFEKLAEHLARYFPYTPNPEGWGRDENRKDIPKKMAS